MSKIIRSISLFVFCLSATGCSLLLDLGNVVLADAGVDSEDADGGVPSEPADAGIDSMPSPRSYTCGYAMPGFHCDNGRSHVNVTALDMTSGIAKCRMAKPMASLDFCNVIDVDSEAPTDASQCTAASGSWRPGNHCCNFEGTLSCP